MEDVSYILEKDDVFEIYIHSCDIYEPIPRHSKIFAIIRKNMISKILYNHCGSRAKDDKDSGSLVIYSNAGELVNINYGTYTIKIVHKTMSDMEFVYHVYKTIVKSIRPSDPIITNLLDLE